jgi:HD-like signal output (HDOD) protein
MTDPFIARMAATLAAGNVQLPAFPQVVINVQEAYRDPKYTPQTISRLISTEPAIGKRLLDMANSTAFNATGKVIIDLGVAINRLGAQKVYSVVLAHAIQGLRSMESLRPIIPRMDQLWSDSIKVAYFCQAVAKRTTLSGPDAFVAGLLHRIGHLYILVQLAQQDPKKPRVTLREDAIQSAQSAIGQAVLKNWGISEDVCEAVGAQDVGYVARSGGAALVDVLIAGIRLAHRMENPHDSASLSSGGVLVRLNLSMEECHSLVAEATADIRMLERALRPL